MLKAKVMVFASVTMCVMALAWVSAAPDDDRRDEDEHHGGDAARIARGFEIAPVTLHFKRSNRKLVGLGSYLVNAVAGCNDCHTNPPFAHGGNPFLGQPKQINTVHYLAGGTAFGPFISRNLTPEDGLPEGHTFTEFLDIFRHGTDFDHAHPAFGPLLQVMPWPVYQNMTDHDIRAIYAYLSAIPPATACTVVGPSAPDPTCRP